MDPIKADASMPRGAECEALVARPYRRGRPDRMVMCYGTAVAYVPDGEGKARLVCRYHLDVWNKQHAGGGK